MSTWAIIFGIVVVPVVLFSILVYGEKKSAKHYEAAKNAQPAPAEEPPTDQAEPAAEVVVHTPDNVVVSVKLVKTVKGKVLMTIATILTIAVWAFFEFYLMSYDKTLGDQIYLTAFFNPFNLTRIAAFVSAFGWFAKDSTCMLLSGVALVGAFLTDLSLFFLLIPAVLFFFAGARLVPEYSIKTTTKQV
jgi:hypothetical protein